MSRKLLTEGIGTFFLVFTIGLAVQSGSPLAPLAIGAMLMTMVYMGGHVSGAHYNPAVTVAMLLRGKVTPAEAVGYVAVQLVGALLASLAAYSATGATFAPAPAPGASVGTVLLVETLFTFALVMVILNVATTRDNEGNSYFGLAIGFTVAAAAFAGGGISGGAFNPAVGIGPSIVHAAMGGGSLGAVWFYLVGPLAGAVLATFAFRMQNPDEFMPPPSVVAASGGSHPEIPHPAEP